jgi:Spy/CpxP family protein refolding chaperone
MPSRTVQLLLGLSLLLNCFVLAGFVYRTWIAPPVLEHGPPPRPGGPLEIMVQELNLNDVQRKALHGLMEKNLADRREHFREIQKAREEISEEVKKETVDLAKVDALVEKVSTLRLEVQKMNLHAILDLGPELTPEQREHMHQILAERFLGFGPPGRPGERRPPGPPPGHGPGEGRPPN